MKHEPLRTCLGCRQAKPKRDLLRVVAQDARLVVDESGRLPGRGAYICPTKSCVQAAAKRRAFERALKAPAADIESEVIEHASKRTSQGA